MNHTSYYPHTSPQKPNIQEGKRPFPFRWFVVSSALLLTGFAVLLFAHTRVTATSNTPYLQETLTQNINRVAAANPTVQIGVAVLTLDNGDLTTYGQTGLFTAASTTKLIAAIDYLRQVEQGRFSLTDTLGVGTSGWQLQQLVQESNDDSWALFYTLLTKPQVQDFAHQIGISSYHINSNAITPADEARLLQMLDDGQLLNARDTQLLLSYMQHTNDETLIPAALPSGATVYHKYGELIDGVGSEAGNWVNDAAIVSYQGHRFVVTIYTNRKDELDIDVRALIIHQITNDVVNAVVSFD